ncbi:longitudinals lacking protein-like [Nilaparvata lugens]|uniref:longitudinals lacking protein-like n=1 Tax=Nilaparvata lugens TaxID=108931 RepID=UPI00193CC5D4|nr:longitudinals lacking protein-like [Nilaparvata lugens]
MVRCNDIHSTQHIIQHSSLSLISQRFPDPFQGLPGHNPTFLRNVAVVSQQPPSTDQIDGNQLGEYPCHKCGKVYLHKASRRVHTLYECGKDPNFKCPFCAHRCKQVGNMRRHVALKHTDIVKSEKLDISKMMFSNS